ncbi:MAG: hypothetical protein ABJA82_08800 [Myxococcales bacterium]
MRRSRRYLLGCVTLLMVAAQCAPAIKRDYSNIPAGRVGFDDMCGLQTYFDRLAMKIGTPPAVLSSNEIQGKGMRSGRSRFTFESDAQLQAVRQVLTENWRRLPDDVMTATPIQLEVRWSERSGVRRVVTNENAELTVGNSRTSLPYHVCLSELLFGEPLYRQRRLLLGLAPLPVPETASVPAAAADGGVVQGPAPSDAAADGRPRITVPVPAPGRD